MKYVISSDENLVFDIKKIVNEKLLNIIYRVEFNYYGEKDN